MQEPCLYNRRSLCPLPSALFPSLFFAPSTQATLKFDHIPNRCLGLGNERKSFVEYMYRALCFHTFFICPRSFINSSDSIEPNVLEAFLGLIRRLSLLYDKIEQLKVCLKLCSPVFVGFQSFALPFQT